MFLRYLVGLREIAEGVVLPVKLDLREDAPSKSQSCLNRLVEAVLIQHWQHTRQSKINKVRMRVGAGICLAESRGEHLVLRLDLHVDSEPDSQLPVFHQLLVPLATDLSLAWGLVLESVDWGGEVHAVSLDEGQPGRGVGR